MHSATGEGKIRAVAPPNVDARDEIMARWRRLLFRLMLATVWIVASFVWGIHPDHLWQAMTLTLLAGLFFLLNALDTPAVRTWKRWRLPVVGFVLTVFAQYGPLK